MANTQAPFGFRPSRRLDGAEPNYALNNFPILNTNTNTIGKGDPVLLNSSGQVDIITPGTGVILGIFWGCEYYDTVQQKKVFANQWAGSSSALAGSVLAYVITDVKMVFDVQVGGSTTTGVVAADVGANINFAGQGAPNTAGFSVAYANQTTINTTNTLPFRIVGFSGNVNNDITSAYDTIQVILNNATFNTTTGV